MHSSWRRLRSVDARPPEPPVAPHAKTTVLRAGTSLQTRRDRGRDETETIGGQVRGAGGFPEEEIMAVERLVKRSAELRSAAAAPPAGALVSA